MRYQVVIQLKGRNRPVCLFQTNDLQLARQRARDIKRGEVRDTQTNKVWTERWGKSGWFSPATVRAMDGRTLPEDIPHQLIADVMAGEAEYAGGAF